MSARIRLLGDFSRRDRWKGDPRVAWPRRQAAALVKLLALRPGRQLHRERVIDSLWPDLRVEEAAPRLYKAAHFSRRVLGRDDAIVLRGDVVTLFPGVEVEVDALVVRHRRRVCPPQRIGGRGAGRVGPLHGGSASA